MSISNPKYQNWFYFQDILLYLIVGHDSYTNLPKNDPLQLGSGE